MARQVTTLTDERTLVANAVTTIFDIVVPATWIWTPRLLVFAPAAPVPEMFAIVQMQPVGKTWFEIESTTVKPRTTERVITPVRFQALSIWGEGDKARLLLWASGAVTVKSVMNILAENV
jgi:hypothetical protein